ncbi:MAG: hypothetical protein ABIP49_09165 [Lysobacterales bacterium]
MNAKTFPILLRREFWEHKGGFFWAPLVAGGLFLLLSMMAIVVGEVAAQKASAAGRLQVDGQVMINGLDLSMLSSHMKPEDAQHLAGGVDLSLLLASTWPFMVLGFVVFFYCLGALYDDRKDRSVLFWRSLPVSDAETVWSKVASASVVAPVLAIAVGIAVMFAFLIVVSLVTLLHSGNPIQLLWGPGSPLKIAGYLIASIPVNLVWALPTIGWLLLCSSWARSKPFLWAVLIPVFAGLLVTWFDLMRSFDMQTLWFWKNVVARSLLSVFPGTWVDVAQFKNIKVDGPQDLVQLFSLKAMYSTFLSPRMWIGAGAGIAMILVAVRLRRWRDDS